MSKPFFRRVHSAGVLFVLGLALIGWPAIGHSALIGGFDSELLLPLNPNNLADKTGVRVLNKSTSGGEVSVELLPGKFDDTLLLPDGFLLLDNTLRVASTLLPGGRRIRARMDFGRFGGRAGIRKLGIRANSIRLLRADLRKGRWIRAVDSIRKRADAEIRFLTEGRADFVLGHHGIDKQNQFVWAVLDTSETQLFAIGGIAIPAPPAWLLLLTGSGLMLVALKRRRRDTR